MKKNVPSGFFGKLLFLLAFVAFFATGNLNAQICLNSSTLDPITLQPAKFVCVKENLLWKTQTFNAPAVESVRWHIVTDNSGGAVFVASGTSADLVVPSAGEFNTVLVKMGPNPGGVEIRMSYESNPSATGCASSGGAVSTQVTGTPSEQVCYNDTGCIQAKAVTLIGGGQPPIDLGPYTYTLEKVGGGILPGSNQDGKFCGLDPADYIVHATSFIGCPAVSPTIHLVNPPFNPVHVTCPPPMVVKSCDYATQALLNAAYDTWYLGFQYSGGTQPISVVRTGSTDYPLLCGGVGHGSIDATDFCKTHDFCASTFTVLAPPPIVPNLPGDKTVNACDVVDLAKLAQIVADYEATFSVLNIGGCDPKITFDPIINPLNLCNATINITGHITDRCDVDIPFLKHLIIGPPTAVGYFIPQGVTYKACDLIDLGDLQGRVDAIKGLVAITPNTGCAPKIVFNPVLLPPDICSGDVIIDGKITDKCDVSIPFAIVIHIEPIVPVGFVVPADNVQDACFYKTQQEVIDAYNAWILGFHPIDNKGCKPVFAVIPQDLPKLCGGVITVHFTVKDKCQLDKDVTALFGVKPATPPVINKCVADVDLKCNPKPEDFPLPGVPDVTSLCPYKVSTSDVDSHVDCFYKRIRTYKVYTDCFPDGVTCEQKITWKVDLTAPIITGTEHTTIPGGDEDGGLCTPTTTVGGPSFTPPSFKSNSPVSFDFGQVRTGDAPGEVISWTNGTTTAQSEYLEGQCVPQRLLMSGLKKGKHTLYIRHEAVKKQDASRHAYDFLTGWDNAIKTGELIGTSGRSLLKNLNAQECDGNWSGAGQVACKGFTTSAKTDIPDVMGNPPNQTGIRNVDDNITCFESQYGNRQMEMEANSAVSGFAVRFLGYDGSDSKSDYAWYAIDWTSDSNTVELKFAGRMAMGGGICGYGNCHGAGSVHGNPYHIIIEGLDGGNAGQRDNQTKCKRSQSCDVNIPVKFKTPIASDCDPVAPVVTPDGTETITTNPDGSVTHCQKWIATDACGNVAHDESCITVVCVLGANFGVRTLGYVAPTSKSIYDTIGKEDVAITKFVAYPNPFRDAVSLSLQTNSTEQVRLDVYDMLGKQLDQRVTTPGEINELKLGEGYPTGIYNLILNQATEQRTIRLLKQ